MFGLALSTLIVLGLSTPLLGAQKVEAGSLVQESLPEQWERLVAAVEASSGDLRDDALEVLHAWYAEQAREDRSRVAFYAYELARREDWTPDPELRIEYWKDVVASHEAKGAVDHAMQTATLPANLLFKSGRFEETAAYTEGLLERLPTATVGRDNHLVRLAEAQRELGRARLALETLQRFDALQPPSRNGAVLVRSDLIRGLVYADLGVLDRCYQYVERGLQLAERRYAEGSGSPNELMTARRVSLLIAKATADPGTVIDRARAYSEEPLYEDHPEERRMLGVLLGTSLLLSRGATTEEKEDAARLLGATAQAGVEPEFEGAARLAIARFRLSRGDLAAAREELASVRTLLERSTKGNLDQVRTDAAMLTARAAFLADAPVEELRRVKVVLDAAVERLVDAWSQVPDRPGGVGFLLYSQRRDVVAESIRLARSLDGDEQALQCLLRMQSLGTLSRRERAPEPTLAEIQVSLLKAGHGLLVYLPAEERTFVFAVDRTGVAVAELGSWATLEDLNRRYRRRLTKPGDDGRSEERAHVDGERRLAHELGRELLPDALLERIRGWRQLTVSGGDLLGHVPFEWLPLEDEEYLGIRRAVSYLPSVPLGVARRRERSDAEPVEGEAGLDVLLVGATTPAPEARERWPEVVDLDVTGHDVRRLLDAYDPGRVRVLVGEQATFSNLKRDLRGARIMQFIGHAVRDYSREQPVGLVMAPGPEGAGLVWYELVSQLQAPDLVILTACRSGVGKQRRGDPGMTDLAGAWIARGSSSAIVALTDLRLGWAIDASALLHERLGAGESPAEALRVLRCRAMEDHGELAPMRSGLLHVVGLGHETVPGLRARKESGAGRWGLLHSLVVATLAVGCVIYVARSRSRSRRNRSARSTEAA